MTETNPHALTGAYALDALDGEELAQFQAHLEVCESCPPEAAELRATAHQLSSLVERTPPAELRARVLQAVDRTAQLPPLPVSRHEPVSLDERRRGGGRRAWGAVGAALALAAAAAGAVFVLDANDTPDAAEIMAAADARTLVSAEDPAAEVIMSPSLDAAVIRVTGMPAAEPGSTYQIWLFDGDAVLPSDTFEPSASGAVTEVLTGAAIADGFGVTVEPDGGSPNGLPSNRPIMVFEVAEA